MPQRNIIITDEQNQFVESIIQSGKYGDVNEVFRAGLRLLEREEQTNIGEQESINRNIKKGIEDIQEGRYTVIETTDDLKKFFAEKHAKRQQWIDQQNL